MMMNKTIIAFLVSAVLITSVNAKTQTNKELMQNEMQEQNISFMWRDSGDSSSITIFKNADPNAVCDLALKYPTVNVTKVVSYSSGDAVIRATCDIPK